MEQPDSTPDRSSARVDRWLATAGGAAGPLCFVCWRGPLFLHEPISCRLQSGIQQHREDGGNDGDDRRRSGQRWCENGGEAGSDGDGGQRVENPRLSVMPFVLALLLIVALVGVAYWLIDKDKVMEDDSSTFYADVVQGIVVLGGAFFGIPLSWRAGQSAGHAKGKAAGQADEQKALNGQKKKIGA
jgi:hypothetical protein